MRTSKTIAALLVFILVPFVSAAGIKTDALKPGEGVLVVFKDGSSMTGVLVKQGRKKIHLDFGGAEMSFDLNTVKSVRLKDNDVKKFQDMVKAAGDDFDLLLQAAAFARGHGLDTYYDRLVARLGVPNQRDIDDSAENAVLTEQTQDAIAAKQAWYAKLAEEKRLEREARRKDEGHGDGDRDRHDGDGQQ